MQASEIRRHILQQQYFIYWKQCQLILKVWTVINRLMTIWKSDLFDKIKWEFFQTVAVSRLLYGCTTCILIKHLEKKLDGNNPRMLYAILNKSLKQHPTKLQLYSHLSSITQTNQVRLTRHTIEDVRTYILLHMNTSVLDDQQKFTSISSVWTLAAI